DRQPPQPLEQQALLLAGRDRADRRGQAVGRLLLEVDPGRVAPLLAVVLAQHLVGDRKQVAAKARLAAEALPTLETGEEGPLDQVRPGLADLVAEEPGDRRV